MNPPAPETAMSDAATGKPITASTTPNPTGNAATEPKSAGAAATDRIPVTAGPIPAMGKPIAASPTPATPTAVAQVAAASARRAVATAVPDAEVATAAAYREAVRDEAASGKSVTANSNSAKPTAIFPVEAETAARAVATAAPGAEAATAAASDREAAWGGATGRKSTTAGSDRARSTAIVPIEAAPPRGAVATAVSAAESAMDIAHREAAPGGAAGRKSTTANPNPVPPTTLSAAEAASAARAVPTAVPDAVAATAHAFSDFSFHRPSDLSEALGLLAEQPDAVPIAGGTDLMVAVNYRLFRPAAMLDLTGLAELREWTDEGDAIRIGSGVPYSRIVAELATVLPGLAAASRTVGSPQIRNRGTLGGNLATASPAGDGHPPLLATDATVEIASAVPPGSDDSYSEVGSSRGVAATSAAAGGPFGSATGGSVSVAATRTAAGQSVGAAGVDAAAFATASATGARSVRTRTVPVSEFFLGPKRSALRPGELITAVIVPKAAGPQQFLKVGTRNAMVIAVCSLAVALDLDARRLGTGIGSAGPTPLTAPDANRIELPWSRPALFNDALAEEFGRRVAAAARPIDDVRGTADYRRHALAVCAARALRRVWTAAHRERTT